MDRFTTSSGRTFAPLPIDVSRGFPQSFAVLFEGRTYQMTLYVNVDWEALTDEVRFLDLPSPDGHLALRIEVIDDDGVGNTLFARKIVSGLEYRIGEIAVTFPAPPLVPVNLRIARENLNGQGDLGSRVMGGIARAWP
jgi:hypothetical protein